MDNNIALQVDKVSKKFCKSLKYTLKYGLIDISKSIFGIMESDTLRPFEFWALKNISFNVKKGESLGIIGINGSGKSTLLKLLNGILLPDEGEVKVRGKVGALIAVGAGFHPMLTGRENIYINATILGLRKKEIDQQFNNIVEFAEIEDFLDTPVKNYSSGMYVRLGFSIAIHCLPDILLVDEILSVGDINFQKKSIKRMQEIINSDKAVIFVSHNMETILSFTKIAIYLKNGQIETMDRTDKVVKRYLSDENKKKNQHKKISCLSDDEINI
ncbi:hypothetical protein A3J78_02065 [Candidatus Beckwithbacteria bacterium RBG_13_35_6]|uniref:ABC transporter domain-containing protein n=1 Tax=Candidatus Beckwithbacteria bacterium RBG_13_35_6 TaxID=1797456 RepID=A0A1F5DDX1_9BACT|nr:MAG: hypothetical protein A3J78_02065 [Candidatus Beckwithbacteria bacterium RBG_13_35_6]